MKMMKSTILLFVATVTCAAAAAQNQPLAVIAKLTGSIPSIQGNVTFTQVGDKVHVTGIVIGLPPCQNISEKTCLRGFHVHDKGDITGGCASAGPHFNPENKSHGHPSDSERHVGDLGNVVVDVTGTIKIDFNDSKISLVGPHSILGRSVVLHETFDDYGKSEAADSKTTGHAGGRIACGVIGILNSNAKWSVSSASIFSSAGVILVPILFLGLMN